MPQSPAHPLVTILMLTYNRAPYIAEAIESTLRQTYSHFELVILDDGSTDTTAEVVACYKDPRIRYMRDTINKGLAQKRAESLSFVTGEFVAILDSDDIWIAEDKLEKQVNYMYEHPDCVVVGTFISLIDSAGTHYDKRAYHTTDTSIREQILWRNQFANSSVLMRTSALIQTRGYGAYAPTEDLELFLQLGQLGTFANLPLYALAYRVHDGGESSRKATLAKMLLTIIWQYRKSYRGAVPAILKYTLLYLLATLRLV